MIVALRADLAIARNAGEEQGAVHAAAIVELEATHENAMRDASAKIEGLEGRLEKLLPGMVASEDGEQGELPASTWAEAVEECGGGTVGYEKARAKYEELFAQHRTSQKENRK